MSNGVKWIHITADVFDNWKVKHLKAMPEIGHALVCIWFELLCLAGKCNHPNGFIVMSEKFIISDEMIADMFNEDVKLVQMALQTFEKLGMIQVTDSHAIQISNWFEYQNEAGLAQIRGYERDKKAVYRAKAALKIEKKMSMDKSTDISTDSSYSLSISNKKDNKSNNNNIYIKEIIDYLNNICDTHYRVANKQTHKLINARFNDGYTVDDFKKVIDNKAAEWKDNPQMCQYLRPNTLFGTKFESYLNQKTVSVPQKPGIEINKKQREGMIDVVEWNI